MFVFLGRSQIEREGKRFQLAVAAHCEDRAEYEATLGDHLADRGYCLISVGEVLPAAAWIARYPSDEATRLARTVSRERPLILAMPYPVIEFGSDWRENWLQIRDLGPVIPLDAQLGADQKLYVPHPLRLALFGPTDPAGAEAGREVPKTYAVLDAARMPFLMTGLLGASGLRHQSLFQGGTQDDLGEYAPYLVELEETNDFTRRLFTSSKGPGGLWEENLGIFIRSRIGFDAIRKNLRRFTRVRDDHGKWYYLRFWESAYLSQLLMKGDPDTTAQLLASGPIIIASAQRKNAATFSTLLAPGQRPFTLRPDDLHALHHAAQEEFLDRLQAWLMRAYDLPQLHDGGDVRLWLRGLLSQAWAIGLRSEKSVADFVAIAWLERDSSMNRHALTDVPPERLPAFYARLHKALSQQKTEKSK